MKRNRTKRVTKTGIVKALEGRMAVTMTTRDEACEHCNSRGSCEALGTKANTVVRALNTADAHIGDTVTIAMASASLLKATFLIYTVPILALIAGILLGFLATHLFGVNENIAVGTCSGVSLVAVFVWLRKKGRELGKRKEFIPEIIARKKVPETLPQSSKDCPVKH